jgi:hypothetical protein
MVYVETFHGLCHLWKKICAAVATFAVNMLHCASAKYCFDSAGLEMVHALIRIEVVRKR